MQENHYFLAKTRVEPKKGDNGLFDVMTSFNEAEIFELVALHLLDKLSSVLGRENVGL